jgi:hypothetical protein
MSVEIEKSKNKVKKSRRLPICNLPVPGPGRPKMTEEEKEKKEIIKKARDEVIKYLEKQGYGAATRIVKLSKEAENETVRLNANKDILDRVDVGVKQPVNAFQFNFNKVREEYE